MTIIKKDEIYDIKNLNDEEIYKILEIDSNIEDHLLEELIKNNINKYKDKDEELTLLFENIYDYFFLEEVKEEIKKEEIKEEGFTNIPSLTSGYNPVIGSIVKSPIEQPKAGLQQIIQYKTDNLNPILKETITRILTINSFDRDNKNDISTNFSLSISESLNNVVSLKLYSVQIPYTWYTIDKNIGSNYFVLQGISPGIDDGNHNIFIDISSGNYTPITLTNAIQTSINNAKNLYSDISFGQTSITYNVSTALTTLNFDIEKRYNETDYYLGFPSNGWTNPNGLNANNSLAGFLGFNYINYFAFSLLSNQTQLPLSTITSTNDSTLSIYYLTNTNNYFTVVQYIPSIAGNTFNYTNYESYINNQINDPTTQYIQTINIISSLTTNAYYTRTQLFNDIANQIVNNNYIDSTISEMIRIDVNNIDYINYGYSYFQILLKLNRFTTEIYKNQKCVLIFPDETNVRIPIWVGSNSCFHYDISVNELNNIYSETASNVDTFTLYTTPFIAFVCNKTGYDVSSNNYYLPINILQNIPITFSEYQNAINDAFEVAQTNSITSFNLNGDFNITNTYIGLDINSHALFSIDINKNMTDNKYYMDISNNNNFLYKELDISYNGSQYIPIDLSNNNIFYSRFVLQGGGYIPFINGPIATFYLKSDYKNILTPPLSIILSGDSSTTYQTISQLENGLNTLFSTYQDSDNQTPLSGSNISLTINNDSTVSCILTINIDKILTQNDYEMVISDLSSNNPYDVINYIDTSNNNYTNTTWYNDFAFKDISFNNGFITLSQYKNNENSYNTFSGSTAIGNSIFTPYLNYDVYKQFFIVPQTSGITDVNNDNVISYTLMNSSYTKNQLIQEINDFLDTNIFTKGSSFSIIDKNGKENIQIRLNIDKTFKAYDYNLIFYSPYNTRICSKYNNTNFTTWDTCLGWILGFKNQPQYLLSNNWDYNTNSAIIISDSVLSIYLYNSFTIVLNDYTHNHLNNGLVTISKKSQNYQDNTIPTKYQSVNQLAVSSQQNYSINEQLNSQTPAQNIYSPGVYLNDVFGIIPLDTSSLTNNQIYIQIASTLQDQNRIYFGPVNIYKMSISLYTDRGQIINLNGSDWSFQIIAEQLYTPTK